MDAEQIRIFVNSKPPSGFSSGTLHHSCITLLAELDRVNGELERLNNCGGTSTELQVSIERIRETYREELYHCEPCDAVKDIRAMVTELDRGNATARRMAERILQLQDIEQSEMEVDEMIKHFSREA